MTSPDDLMAFIRSNMPQGAARPFAPQATSSDGYGFAGNGGFGSGAFGGGHGTGYTPGMFGMNPGSGQFQNRAQNGLGGRIGSVDYNAIGNIQNWLSQTGPAGANYLRSMGLMPNVGQYQPGQLAPGVQPSRFGNSRMSGAMEGRTPSTFGTYGQQGTAYGPGSGGVGGFGGTPGATGGGFGLGSLGGSGSVPTSGLDQKLADAYGAIIDKGGRTYSPTDEAVLSQRAADTVNRGSRDAIDTLRQNAARRGLDPMGQQDAEARIAQRGTADAINARQNVSLGQNQNAMQALIAALGGAGSYQNQQSQLQLALGALAAQQGPGGGLSKIFGGR